jgi:predicted RNase H-like nuclease (RuvC/YqgF family)
MEDAQRTYKPDDEFGDLYVSLGADGTKSKEECINLIETIKGLQKDVQSYTTDNERLMKANEQQYDFNIKLMQSLDIIEKKMDKEIETNRSRSCRSHDERKKNKKC